MDVYEQLEPVGTGRVHAGVAERVGMVRLTDPDHRNALSIEMAHDIAAAVEQVSSLSHAVVLSAEAPVFCSGGVLEDLLEPRAPLSEFYAAFTALLECEVPTIAAVDGAAIGAGVNLPISCDVVIAGPGARFDPRFLDAGIHPGGGHLRLLGRAAGFRNAAAMSLLGGVLDNEGAVRTGLAWASVADSSELLEAAHALADRAAGRNRELLVRAKDTLYRSASMSHTEAVDIEAVAQAWSMQAPWFRPTIERIQQVLASRSKDH